jgi:hypothetical protein
LILGRDNPLDVCERIYHHLVPRLWAGKYSLPQVKTLSVRQLRRSKLQGASAEATRTLGFEAVIPGFDEGNGTIDGSCDLPQSLAPSPFDDRSAAILYRHIGTPMHKPYQITDCGGIWQH